LLWKSGFGRGGEEALKVNPARDQYFSQYGAPGTGPGSGFMNVAAALTQITGEHGGGSAFRALVKADTMKEFEAAQRNVTSLLSRSGAMAGGGPTPMPKPQPSSATASAGAAGANISITIQALDGADVQRVFRDKLLPQLKQALLNDTDGLLTTQRRRLAI
jgi:hypothetical protein